MEFKPQKTTKQKERGKQRGKKRRTIAIAQEFLLRQSADSICCRKNAKLLVLKKHRKIRPRWVELNAGDSPVALLRRCAARVIPQH